MVTLGLGAVNYLVVVGILVGFIVWMGLNRRLYGDAFSPLNILWFSWVLPFGVRGLGLSELESEWEYPTIMILVWVTLCLILTSAVAAPIVGKGGSFFAGKALFVRTLCLVRRGDFRTLVVLFWIISVAAYIYAEFATNPAGIPLISVLLDDRLVAGAFHRWGKETRWVVVTGLLFVLTPMLYLAFRASRGIISGSVFLCMAVSFPVMGFMKLSRSDVFIGGLNIILVEYYYRRFASARPGVVERRGMKDDLVALAIPGILFLAIMYGTLAVRMGGSSPGNVYAQYIGFKLGEQGPLSEMLAQVYGYAALPFENFHAFFASYEGGYNLGISFFRPLLSATGQGELADEIEFGVPFTPAVSGAAGSGTFLTSLYAELNMEGLLIVPIIYGVLVNGLYVRFRKRPSFMNCFLYFNFVYPWTWLYFNNAFSALTFYINGAFVAMVTILLVVVGGCGREKPILMVGQAGIGRRVSGACRERCEGLSRTVGGGIV